MFRNSSYENENEKSCYETSVGIAVRIPVPEIDKG